MDAIEILGGLLGRKTSSSSSSGGSGLGSIGGKILKDILFGGAKPSQPAPRAEVPRSEGSRSEVPRGDVNRGDVNRGEFPGGRTSGGSLWGSGGDSGRSAGRGDLAAQARELEELLNVANKRKSGSNSASGGRVPPTSGFDQRSGNSSSSDFETPQERSNQNWGAPSRQSTAAKPKSPPASNSPFSNRVPAPPASADDQALVLVRAMINAAKADGQISHDEQQAILQQVGDSSPETVSFLRQEFNKPLDVREFAWSVPQGLEQQVYAMSLMAIDLDKQSEAAYLFDLSHALRLSAETCREIHNHYGVPPIH